jgi:hypothetical protein
MKTDKVKTWKSLLKIEAAIKTKIDEDCILFALNEKKLDLL